MAIYVSITYSRTYVLVLTNPRGGGQQPRPAQAKADQTRSGPGLNLEAILHLLSSDE